MNKFVSILCLTILCTACVTQEDNFQSKEMNYVCSSLTKNYLRISQLDYYEVWNKAQSTPDTILFLYAKSQTNGQIAFNPNTRLLECKKEKYKYILSEIDQHSLKTRPILILRLPI
jgi:hypothetical protein